MAIRLSPQKEHEKRLVKWGGEPDLLKIDTLLCSILKKFDLDPSDLLAEISFKRRTKGKYAFASRRIITTSQTGHEVLTSLPPEFPPLTLRAGYSKNSFVIIDRLLPGSSFDLHYQSNRESSSYFLNRQKFAAISQNGFLGSPVSEMFSGIPDERIIQRAVSSQKSGFSGTSFAVESSFVEYPQGEFEASTILPYYGALKNAAGQSSILENIAAFDARNAQNTPKKRRELHLAGITYEHKGKAQNYLLLLPVDTAKSPRFKTTGSGWDRILECHIIPEERLLFEDISAAIQKAKQVHYHSAMLLDRLDL